MAEKREKRKPEQLQKTCSGRQKKSNYLQEGHGISGIFGEMKWPYRIRDMEDPDFPELI